MKSVIASSKDVPKTNVISRNIKLQKIETKRDTQVLIKIDTFVASDQFSSMKAGKTKKKFSGFEEKKKSSFKNILHGINDEEENEKSDDIEEIDDDFEFESDKDSMVQDVYRIIKHNNNYATEKRINKHEESK